MRPYLTLLQHILDHGIQQEDRTGVGTLSVFGYQMRFDLNAGFPLVTTKKLHLKSIVYELLWFLRGDTNIRYLNENGVHIWDAWADENGNLGPIYGRAWRFWPAAEGQFVDQIAQILGALRQDPPSRRMIINAWNVAELPKMAIPPCHVMAQFYVAQEKLSCQLYQRSADCFLCLPFNIASYSLLTHMMAQQSELDVGEFIWTGGDCHLYSNHLEPVREQLTRTPYPAPRLVIQRKPNSIDEYCYTDFDFDGYQHHPAIKGTVAV